MQPVPGEVELYATEEGNLISMRSCAPRLKKARLHNGYLCVTIKSRKVMVHRAVCAAFHGPCPDGMQCRHLNGNAVDNRPGNLRWGTARENYADAVQHGTLGLGERAPGWGKRWQWTPDARLAQSLRMSGKPKPWKRKQPGA